MTDMDRLIEDVARALILADDAGNPDIILASTEHDGECTKRAWTCPLCAAELFRTLARAAILATLKGIREPTPEMCLVGKFQLYDCNERGCGDAIRHTFGKMLDRLIAEVESQHG